MKKAAVPILLTVGLLQMTGDLLKLDWLKGFGAATVASPAPKVFSAVRGMETFSTRFFLEWSDIGDRKYSLEITSEVYFRLQGPYNRRNVYGAAIAYGPILASDERTVPMFDSVFRFAVCGKAPLLQEFGIDPSQVKGPVRICYEPLAGTEMGDLPQLLEADCR